MDYANQPNAEDHLPQPEGEKPLTQKIAIITGHGMLECFFEHEIIAFFGDDTITYVWVEDRTQPLHRRRLVCSKNLKHYEDLLPPDVFIRTCKNRIINFYRIKYIEGDTLILTGMEDEAITLKGKYKKLVFNRLNKM